MGDLMNDTEIVGTDGVYQAKISPEWDIWGPNGGYLSALALRAAQAETDLIQPISYYCHYLRPGTSGTTADLRVTTSRRSPRAHALRVELSQDDQRILDALIWVASPTGAVDYDATAMPQVPGPDELRTNEEIHSPDKAPFVFWDNIEVKPVTWTRRWDEMPVMHPLWQAWNRFRPTATFDDPFVDACRALILIDTWTYPAATLAHEGTFPFVAPSMDLNVRFHRQIPGSEWLLASAETPIGIRGIIGGDVTVWSEDGHLVATGAQQMIAR